MQPARRAQAESRMLRMKTRRQKKQKRPAVPPAFGRLRRVVTTSLVLELRLVDLVLSDLVGDAAPRQTRNLRTATDVAARLAKRLLEVTLLERHRQLMQQL